jgi:hypothetical protein
VLTRPPDRPDTTDHPLPPATVARSAAADHWPPLLDDADVWRPVAPATDPHRLALLEREQEGGPWNG